MRNMLESDTNGLELLEMFCGEGAVDVVWIKFKLLFKSLWN
jgi:hypothetical protein